MKSPSLSGIITQHHLTKYSSHNVTPMIINSQTRKRHCNIAGLSGNGIVSVLLLQGHQRRHYGVFCISAPKQGNHVYPTAQNSCPGCCQYFSTSSYFRNSAVSSGGNNTNAPTHNQQSQNNRQENDNSQAQLASPRHIASGSEFYKQFHQLLKQEGYNSKEALLEAPLSIKTSLLRQAMWNCQQDLYLQSHERHQISELLGIKELQLQSYLKVARGHRRKGRPGVITSEAKELIRSWLEKNNYRVPNAEERKDLIEATGLGNKQVVDQIYYLRSKPGTITDDVKQIIKKWLEKNDYRLPTRQERNLLEEQTGLASYQLNGQLYYLREDPQSVSKSVKKTIEEWLEEHEFRKPTTEEKQELKQRTGISSKQLDTQLRHFMDHQRFSGVHSEEARKVIQQWLKENDNRSPSSEERDELQHLTGMGRHHLNCTVMRLRDTPGEITPQAKDIIREWLKKHDNRMPTTQEKDDLANQTGLSRMQVYNQVVHLRVKPIRITEKIRKFVSDWAEENTYTPSALQKDYLIQHTKLSPRQLSNVLNALKEDNGAITEETKSIVRTWLYDNDFRSRLTSKERFELMTKTGWSRNQLKNQLRLLSEENGEITPETQDVLKRWLEENNNVSPTLAERKKLLELTNWSASQLRHQLRELLNPKGEITKESKEHLRKWLLEHNFRKPYSDEREELLELTGWNSRQLSDQLKRMSG